MRRSGFTLIEMTFALILIGVLTGGAVPPLMRWHRDMALASSVDRFERLHELARITAIREGRIAELHLDPTNRLMWVEVDTTDAGVSDTVAVVQDFEEDVSFEADRTVLCFDSRGLPTSVGACDAPDATVAFTLASNNQVDSTRITLLGKIVR